MISKGNNVLHTDKNTIKRFTAKQESQEDGFKYKSTFQ